MTPPTVSRDGPGETGVAAMMAVIVFGVLALLLVGRGVRG